MSTVIFSKKCEYALRSLVYLAQSSPVCGARQISRSQNVPYHFIGKVLHELKGKGLVKSVRGAGGGFALARAADRISLIEVVRALECDDVWNRCIYGFGGCSDSHHCPLHEGWKPIRDSINVYLTNHTIGDLARPLAGFAESGVIWQGDVKPHGLS